MQFVRNTSGLVKNASLADSMMLNIANMGAGLAIFTGISPYITPGAVLWIASIITFVLSLPLVFLYTFFIIQIHRTGGDYVWLSRKLNGKIGSIMGIAIAFNMPPYFALSAFFSVAAINTVLLTIGKLNNQVSLINLANSVFVNPYATITLSQEILIYVLSAIAFGIIIAINIFRPKWGFKIVTALGTLAILGTLAAIIVLAVNIPDFHTKILPFLEDFNLTPSTYTGPKFSLPATFYMVPYFASFAYIWLYAGPAVSAEIKSERGIKYNIILGSLMTFLLITVPFFLMDLAGGYGFNFSLYSTGTYNFWSVAIALAGNEALQWFIGLSLIAWEFFVMAFGVVVFARYVFAFSFDRLFPEVFSKLNTNNSPVYAHLLDFVVTLIFLSFPIISPVGVQALYSYTPLAIAYLFLVGLAGVKFAKQINNTPMLITAIISAIFMIFMGYEAFTNPYFGVITTSGAPYWPGIAYILSLVGLGIIIYSISKYVNLKRGINIDLNYKEIPPE
ncbi:amino acid permease [Acidianus sulfidivorans JP7]|uniref:Amino acid permease n=1 Tax=Acidianus sulfidivorans JP7 TaxID=619593 RepID=A0A2U9IL29_9CREN|nr:amino acid permease [Acidianus sulfidivorans]AWR96726.1 amino acid permease [Acidianus sulfidivorans JP7]